MPDEIAASATTGRRSDWRSDDDRSRGGRGADARHDRSRSDRDSRDHKGGRDKDYNGSDRDYSTSTGRPSVDFQGSSGDRSSREPAWFTAADTPFKLGMDDNKLDRDRSDRLDGVAEEPSADDSTARRRLRLDSSSEDVAVPSDADSSLEDVDMALSRLAAGDKATEEEASGMNNGFKIPSHLSAAEKYRLIELEKELFRKKAAGVVPKLSASPGPDGAGVTSGGKLGALPSSSSSTSLTGGNSGGVHRFGFALEEDNSAPASTSSGVVTAVQTKPGAAADSGPSHSRFAFASDGDEDAGASNGGLSTKLSSSPPPSAPLKWTAIGVDAFSAAFSPEPVFGRGARATAGTAGHHVTGSIGSSGSMPGDDPWGSSFSGAAAGSQGDGGWGVAPVSTTSSTVVSTANSKVASASGSGASTSAAVPSQSGSGSSQPSQGITVSASSLYACWLPHHLLCFCSAFKSVDPNDLFKMASTAPLPAMPTSSAAAPNEVHALPAPGVKTAPATTAAGPVPAAVQQLSYAQQQQRNAQQVAAAKQQQAASSSPPPNLAGMPPHVQAMFMQQQQQGYPAPAARTVAPSPVRPVPGMTYPYPASATTPARYPATPGSYASPGAASAVAAAGSVPLAHAQATTTPSRGLVDARMTPQALHAHAAAQARAQQMRAAQPPSYMMTYYPSQPQAQKPPSQSPPPVAPTESVPYPAAAPPAPVAAAPAAAGDLSRFFGAGMPQGWTGVAPVPVPADKAVSASALEKKVRFRRLSLTIMLILCESHESIRCYFFQQFLQG